MDVIVSISTLVAHILYFFLNMNIKVCTVLDKDHAIALNLSRNLKISKKI